MSRRFLIFVLLAPVWFLPTSSGAAAEAEPSRENKNADRPHWIYSFLPQAVQKNPTLEITVITEMTDAGKKLPRVSPEHPVFYQAHSLGSKSLGDPAGGEKPIDAGELERVLFRSLALNGYQPARTSGPPPSIVIIYYWGAHNVLNEGDADNPSLPVEVVRRNILDRAALVGGAKFARELHVLMQEADDYATAASAQLATDGRPPISPGLVAFANPVNLFKLGNAKNELLLNQIAGDLHYVVASAYDYQSVAANNKILLWRTRMTVSARGTSQRQAVPAMILGAGPFFGREMKETEIISKRAVPEGSVEVGTPTVIAPPSAPTTK